MELVPGLAQRLTERHDSGPVHAGGPPGTLPCPLPLTSFAVESVAHAAQAANRLMRVRGGTARFSIDTRAVALAFDSLAMLAIDGQAAEPWAPLSGFYRASDGWVRLHGNYPHHERAALAALGLHHGSGVRAAVASRGAQEVEDSVFAAGGCATKVRSATEWKKHEHAVAQASEAWVELMPSPRGPLPLRPTPAGPMAGLQVLDLTRVIAGPVCTRLLGALGADVLRVDPPWLPELRHQHIDTGFAKRTALADIAVGADRDLVEHLLGEADLLVTGYRPGAMALHGLDAAQVTDRHPHLAVVELSAWGSVGPWRNRRGFDSLVQAATGIALACATTDDEDPGPGALPVQALDHATGYLVACRR